MESEQSAVGLIGARFDGQFGDVLVVLGILALGALSFVALDTVSVFVLAAVLLALSLQLYGMLPQSSYDGPSVTVLALFFVGIGAVAVL
ncbi:hypothetical protein [Haloarchaeobius iranensis]|uniref:Uncharacterized protein n=1 Tax=Haloarchaeobius iranensis TaxID=996166 RepID=A0A1G9SAK3_9EURY|nr:hypothetical protein [Haloarchaeobius iranensis]SDM32449.1 hypothetical protein SAMN05192554_10147 [Haloarchaeobius iranensis]